MKKIYFSLLAVVLLLSSCEQVGNIIDTQAENNKKAEGIWELASATSSVEVSGENSVNKALATTALNLAFNNFLNADSTIIVGYAFNTDSTFISYVTDAVEGVAQYGSGTYSLTTDSLFLVYESPSVYTDAYRVFTLNDTELSLYKDYGNILIELGASILGNYAGVSLDKVEVNIKYNKYVATEE